MPYAYKMSKLKQQYLTPVEIFSVPQELLNLNQCQQLYNMKTITPLNKFLLNCYGEYFCNILCEFQMSLQVEVTSLRDANL
jgi:hypothetical protein